MVIIKEIRKWNPLTHHFEYLSQEMVNHLVDVLLEIKLSGRPISSVKAKKSLLGNIVIHVKIKRRISNLTSKMLFTEMNVILDECAIRCLMSHNRYSLRRKSSWQDRVTNYE